MKIPLGLKGPGILFVPILIMVLTLSLISLCAACAGQSATTTQAPNGSVPAVTTKAPISTAPASTAAAPAKPEGELVASLADFGNENFLPWLADASSSQVCDVIYDVLTYYDEINGKYIPGLAERWEVSPDALTTTFYLRKGVQFSEGWGELTSADVQYNFEKHAGKNSVGQVTAARQVKSMETPDPYTLVVHMKAPAPTFFGVFSLGNGGVCQGIVSKKYVETVGESIAAQKPIGTGPFKLMDSKSGSVFKFEAVDSHWRVIPEFKTLTIRMAPEISTIIAMLKNKEIDLSTVPAEQMADLKAAGVATEVSPNGGGGIFNIAWGGMVIPEDDRYDPTYHQKDPWVDVRIRKAMSLAIDRQAICNAIFAGGATPAGVPLFNANMGKYLYPFDPATAKQLLIDAGYPNGFSFKLISYTLRGVPETPRVIETLAAYWQQIGLDPQITAFDYTAYGNTHRGTLRNAGEIYLNRMTPVADMLEKGATHFMPGAVVFCFEDEGSYAIYKEGREKINAEERDAYVDKLNQYYFENYCGSLARTSYCYAWNSAKISPFPHSGVSAPYYFEYVRHAEPINTFRLFTPWPGR